MINGSNSYFLSLPAKGRYLPSTASSVEDEPEEEGGLAMERV